MQLSRRAALVGGLSLLSLPLNARASAPLRTLSDGSFELSLSMLSRGRDEAEVAAALKSAGWPTDSARSVLNVTLIDLGSRRILVDSGAGPNFMAGAGQLPAALKVAGIEPDSITDVIFTHAHPDHLWGALDDFDEPFCPNARYRMALAEIDNWRSPRIYEQLPPERHAFAAGAQRVLKGLDKVMEPFKPGDELAPGVHAFATPGHTPGHISLAVQAGGETTYVLGDALTHAIISFQYPEWQGGMDQDAPTAINTRKALLDRLAGEQARLIGYHLPDGGIGRVERAGAAYRFVAG